MNPELSAKPIVFMLLLREERLVFDSLTKRQQGYFLHWWRSNKHRNPTFEWLAKRAREQRP